MNNGYIGVDLGTSSVKLLLVLKDGQIIKTVTKEYPVSYPQSGWSEQNPQDWINAVKSGVKELISNFDGTIKGISFGGQMHGLVALDENDRVIRPAILWNDGRTQKEVDYLNEVVGKEELSKYTANIAFAGFTAPKIMWLKENEPENYKRISKVMLPKDYVAYYLSGVHATDYSDASGMLLLDVRNKCWSKQMCEICSVNINWLPKLFESYESIGKVKKELLNLWGLEEDVNVVIGAGDNAAAAIGTGTIADGDCTISLGTSGTVFISQDNFSVDDQNALHSFAHATGKYHLMGCILSAASCNSWWLNNILETNDFDTEFSELNLGKNDIYFLPYLMGERSPHNDTNATGSLIGLRPTTTRKELNLAILEGVSFALRDCIEVAKLSGLNITSAKLCGGGAKSKVWQEVLANILNVPLVLLQEEQGPAFGAAILAMIGCNEYETIDEAVKEIVKEAKTITPNNELAKKYGKKYQLFRHIYPNQKELYKILNSENNN